MNKEIWKKIPRFLEYEASSLGQIRKGNHILKQCLNQCGYYCVGIYDPNHTSNTSRVLSVHNLVIEAFTGIPAIKGKRAVDHVDGNKYNNRIENLEYVSYKENMRRARERKLISSYPHRVICTTDNKVFDSISECTKYYGYYIHVLGTLLYNNNKCDYKGKHFIKLT